VGDESKSESEKPAPKSNGDRPGSQGQTLLVALAVALAFVVASLSWALSTPSHARTVSFEGGWDIRPTCQGPSLWTGDVLWATCDWVYHRRALVRIDPHKGQATVVDRWEIDDGNLPDLAIAQRCGEDRLFVVQETAQARLIRVGQGGVTTAVVAEPKPGSLSHNVIGAACRDDGFEVLVREGMNKAVSIRVVSGKTERGEVFESAQIAGAWFEGDQWHGVVVSSKAGLTVGPLAGGRTVLDPDRRQSVCAVGAPGGWLMGCHADRFVTKVGETFKVHERPPKGTLEVVYETHDAIAGFSASVGSQQVALSTLGSLALEVAELDDSVAAKRSGGPPRVIAGAPSSFTIGATLLPLPDDEVMVWGCLGQCVATLGSHLERQDAMGLLSRMVRPVGPNPVMTLAYLFVLVGSPLMLAWVRLSRRPWRKQGSFNVGAVGWVYLVLYLVAMSQYLNALRYV
jgi:hypothetical protein